MGLVESAGAGDGLEVKGALALLVRFNPCLSDRPASRLLHSPQEEEADYHQASWEIQILVSEESVLRRLRTQVDAVWGARRSEVWYVGS